MQDSIYHMTLKLANFALKSQVCAIRNRDVL